MAGDAEPPAARSPSFGACVRPLGDRVGATERLEGRERAGRRDRPPPAGGEVTVALSSLQRSILGLQRLAGNRATTAALRTMRGPAPVQRVDVRDAPPETAGGEDVGAHAPEQLRFLARQLLDRARIAEKYMTARLREIATDNGAQLVGLESRFKRGSSLAGKIARYARAAAGRTTLAEAAAEIGDVLRYTLLVDPERYMATHRRALEALAAKGCTIVRDKNFWPLRGAYRGINTQLRGPSGLIFELQFHTPESFEMKGPGTHALYEEARQPTTSAARRAEIANEMTRLSDTLRVPPGALAT